MVSRRFTASCGRAPAPGGVRDERNRAHRREQRPFLRRRPGGGEHLHPGRTAEPHGQRKGEHAEQAHPELGDNSRLPASLPPRHGEVDRERQRGQQRQERRIADRGEARPDDDQRADEADGHRRQPPPSDRLAEERGGQGRQDQRLDEEDGAGGGKRQILQRPEEEQPRGGNDHAPDRQPERGSGDAPALGDPDQRQEEEDLEEVARRGDLPGRHRAAEALGERVHAGRGEGTSRHEDHAALDAGARFLRRRKPVASRRAAQPSSHCWSGSKRKRQARFGPAITLR
jgi:hypothetical protein